MWFTPWLRSRPVSRKPRAASRFRPALEALEERAVPATFTVNTTLDVLRSGRTDTTLSLRQAIIDANASKTADTIILPASSVPYTLTRAGAGEDNCLTGDLDINGPLTINGAGAGLTIVDAAQLDRVFQMSGHAVTFSGMTIQGGSAVISGLGSEGGGINNRYVAGVLTVNNCVIAGNTAGYDGGGIYSGGSLTVNNSVISNNLANTGSGGGIYNIGKMTVSNSTLSGNSALGLTGYRGNGGGIYHAGSGTMTVQSSTLSKNSAFNNGGGIYSNATRYYPGMVQDSIISDNTALHGGGIAVNNGGILTVQNSTLSGNSAFQGGAFYLWGTLTVSNSIVSGNSASQGGGLFNYGGNATVEGTTFTGNSATEYGGGIANKGGSRLTVRGSTLLDNSSPLGADLYNLGILSIDSGSTIGVTAP